jgi:predicted RNase H-like nuclease (RuvC/YqgF family)
LDVTIATIGRQLEKKREQMQNDKRSVEEFQDEVATVRNELEKMEREVKTAELVNGELGDLDRQKKAQVESLRNLVDITRNALNGEYEATDNLGTRAAKVHSLCFTLAKTINNQLLTQSK